VYQLLGLCSRIFDDGFGRWPWVDFVLAGRAWEQLRAAKINRPPSKEISGKMRSPNPSGCDWLDFRLPDLKIPIDQIRFQGCKIAFWLVQMSMNTPKNYCFMFLQ
jgi:hypothetical protein